MLGGYFFQSCPTRFFLIGKFDLIREAVIFVVIFCKQPQVQISNLLKHKIVVTCPPKVNHILAQEIEDLGYTVRSIDRMGVRLEGTLNDTMHLNLHLRSGSKVLFEVKFFRANTPEKLYQRMVQINWEEYLDPNGYFSIDSYVKNDFINDSRYANLKAKDAIVDRMVKVCNRRPDTGSKRDKTVLFLHWQLNECSIYIDTSGETIAKHGYRKIPFKAPMLESLAAATILTSRWEGKGTFVNPMCGSGTLAIEAALIAANIAPGLLRENFGFMHIVGYNYAYWEKIRQEAIDAVKEDIDVEIIASDISLEALRAAKENAKNAGVDDLIRFQHCDFKETKIPHGEGVVFLNPEYGGRLGEEKSLEEVYKAIGDFFKQQCQGYMGYIFTGNLNLAKKIGLKTKRRIEFFNGKIDCRLLEYELYAGRKKNDTLPS